MIFAFCIIGLTGFTQVNLQNGLIGYWPFNGNADDKSGNGNNGTVSGAVLTTDRFDSPNKAYLFNGGASYIKSNPTLPVGSAARSLSIWFKTTSNSGYNGYNNNTLISWGNPSPNQMFSPSVYIGELLIGIYANPNDIWTGRIVNDGIWHFLCITYDGAVVNVYLDGSVINTANRTFNTSSSELQIGQRIGQSSQAMNGSLDDIRIYNRSLNVEEVFALYNEGNTTTNIPNSTDHRIRIFPNPTSDYITINYDHYSNSGLYTLEIYNLQAQLVLSKPMIREQTTIDLKSLLNKGLYFVYLKDKQSNVLDISKVILQ